MSPSACMDNNYYIWCWHVQKISNFFPPAVFLEIWKTAHLGKTTIMDIYGNVMNKFPI